MRGVRVSAPLGLLCHRVCAIPGARCGCYEGRGRLLPQTICALSSHFIGAREIAQGVIWREREWGCLFRPAASHVVILLFAYEGCATGRKGHFLGVVEGNARRGVRMSAGVCKSRVSQGLAGVEDRGSQEDVTLKKIEAAGAKGEILCAIMLSVGMK